MSQLPRSDRENSGCSRRGSSLLKPLELLQLLPFHCRALSHGVSVCWGLVPSPDRGSDAEQTPGLWAGQVRPDTAFVTGKQLMFSLKVLTFVIIPSKPKAFYESENISHLYDAFLVFLVLVYPFQFLKQGFCSVRKFVFNY